MNESRSAPRKSVRFLVQHQASSEGGYELDYARDLSPGGLFIASRATPAPSATVHVQFAPKKDAALVSTFARVTHVTSEGFGAAFVGLDPETRQLIASAL